MLAQASANVVDSRLSSMIIVAAAGISAGSELQQFLHHTGIRAIHAGSSVTTLQYEECNCEDAPIATSREQQTSASPIHMGSNPSARDTFSFSCTVAAKVHELVSQAISIWNNLDQLAVHIETGRLLAKCAIGAEQTSSILEDDVLADETQLHSHANSAQGNSDDEYFAEARVV